MEMEFGMERIMCWLKTHHLFSSMLLAPVPQREAGLATKTLGAPCPDVPFPPQPAVSCRHPPQAVCGWDVQTHSGLWSSWSGSGLGLALEGLAAQATPRTLLGAGGMCGQYCLPGGSRRGMEHCAWVSFPSFWYYYVSSTPFVSLGAEDTTPILQVKIMTKVY